MADAVEEFDSRTSIVGRKRNLQELTQDRDAADVTDESDDEGDRGPKRVKEAHDRLSESGAIEDGMVINVDTSLGESGGKPGSALLKEPVGDLETPRAAASPPSVPERGETEEATEYPGVRTASAPTAPAVAWNKGIQGGLRISFGRKAQGPRKPKRGLLGGSSDDDGAQSNADNSIQSKESQYREASTPRSRADSPLAASGITEEAQKVKRSSLGSNTEKVQQPNNQPIIQRSIRSKDHAHLEASAVRSPVGSFSLSGTALQRIASFKPLSKQELGSLSHQEKEAYFEDFELYFADRVGRTKQNLVPVPQGPIPEETMTEKVNRLMAIRGKRRSKREVQEMDRIARNQYQAKDKALKEAKRAMLEKTKFVKARYTLEPATQKAAAAIAEFGWPLPEGHRDILNQILEGKTLYPSEYHLRNKNDPLKYRHFKRMNGEIKIHELFDTQGKPVSVEDFSYNIFAPLFYKENQLKLAPVTPKVLKQVLVDCFGIYVDHFYQHTRSSLWLKPTATASDALTVEEVKSQAALSTMLESTSDNIETTSGSIENGKSSIGLSQPGGSGDQSEIATPASNSPMNENDLRVNSEDQNEDSDPDSSSEDSSDEGMGIDRGGAEAALRQKYFPSSTSTNPQCLSCAKKGHSTINCPARYCSTCGKTGEHPENACPENQRCSKCRERGHKTAACQEKLALSKTEAVPCDLCGSKDHIEVACHYIWRSFDPTPEEIVTVRNLIIDCYSCGASGHYGPECELNRNKALFTGGLTWSKQNFQKYVDSNSQKRAISAGTDYSIPPRPPGSNGRGFSIKGQANDPITLDDSEEESFIRPRVQLSNNQRRHIQFGNSNRQPPLRPRLPSPDLSSRPHPSNPPRQAHPAFDRTARQGFNQQSNGGNQSYFAPPSYQQAGPQPGASPFPRRPNPNQGNKAKGKNGKKRAQASQSRNGGGGRR